MFSPGEYLPDPTEGITQPQDLPKAKIISKSLQFEFVVFFSVSLVVQALVRYAESSQVHRQPGSQPLVSSPKVDLIRHDEASNDHVITDLFHPLPVGNALRITEEVKKRLPVQGNQAM